MMARAAIVTRKRTGGRSFFMRSLGVIGDRGWIRQVEGIIAEGGREVTGIRMRTGLDGGAREGIAIAPGRGISRWKRGWASRIPRCRRRCEDACFRLRGTRGACAWGRGPGPVLLRSSAG